MIFNHEATSLTEVIGIKKEDMDNYFENTVWATYDRIREDKELTKPELAQVIVHLVGVYDGSQRSFYVDDKLIGSKNVDGVFKPYHSLT